ncbi:hypothetical protein [Mucilaginibacter sp.]
MKTENNMSGDSRDSKSPIHSNNYNNEQNSGTIGAEGGNDNGASTLRALKKKNSERTKSTRRPML